MSQQYPLDTLARQITLHCAELRLYSSPQRTCKRSHPSGMKLRAPKHGSSYSLGCIDDTAGKLLKRCGCADSSHNRKCAESVVWLA